MKRKNKTETLEMPFTGEIFNLAGQTITPPKYDFARLSALLDRWEELRAELDEADLSSEDKRDGDALTAAITILEKRKAEAQTPALFP